MFERQATDVASRNETVALVSELRARCIPGRVECPLSFPGGLEIFKTYIRILIFLPTILREAHRGHQLLSSASDAFACNHFLGRGPGPSGVQRLGHGPGYRGHRSPR